MFHNNRLALIPVALFFVLAICLWQGLSHDPRLVPSTLLNKPLPTFDLPDLLHPQQRINVKNWLGKPALVNVWGSWCVSCIAENGVLINLVKPHIAIYGLNYKDDAFAAKKWLQKYGNPYQSIAFDSQGDTAIDWGIYGTPETFLIDSQGVIRYKLVGVLSPEIWQKKLLPLIEKMTS